MPLGLDWIELGLNSVLYDPKTRQIYTPNTNETAMMQRSAEVRYNPNRDPETGQYTNGPGGSGSGGGSGGSSGGDSSGDGLTGGGNGGIISHREEIIDELRSNGFTYEVHIPAMSIDADSLSVDSLHITRRRHNVSDEQARSFVKNAKMSYTKTVNGETFENFIGEDGAAYVSVDTGLIRTAFPSSQFNPGVNAILETLRRYEE